MTTLVASERERCQRRDGSWAVGVGNALDNANADLSVDLDEVAPSNRNAADAKDHRLADSVPEHHDRAGSERSPLARRQDGSRDLHPERQQGVPDRR